MSRRILLMVWDGSSLQGKATRGRAEERGDVLQVEQVDDAGAALHKQDSRLSVAYS